jgi:hypothetical protein
MGLVVPASPCYLFSKKFVYCLCCISVFGAKNATCECNSYFGLGVQWHKQQGRHIASSEEAPDIPVLVFKVQRIGVEPS